MFNNSTRPFHSILLYACCTGDSGVVGGVVVGGDGNVGGGNEDGVSMVMIAVSYLSG